MLAPSSHPTGFPGLRVVSRAAITPPATIGTAKRSSPEVSSRGTAAGIESASATHATKSPALSAVIVIAPGRASFDQSFPGTLVEAAGAGDCAISGIFNAILPHHRAGPKGCWPHRVNLAFGGTLAIAGEAGEFTRVSAIFRSAPSKPTFIHARVLE